MSLVQRIAELKEEIKGYVAKMDASVEKDQQVLFADLIKSRRETLNRLLDQQRSLLQGKSIFHEEQSRVIFYCVAVMHG